MDWHTLFPSEPAAWIVPAAAGLVVGILAATDLLTRNASPSDDEIAAHMSGNICRCCTYQRIKLAVRRAADSLA